MAPFRVLRSLAVVGTAALALSACGNDGPSGTPAPTPSTTPSTTLTTTGPLGDGSAQFRPVTSTEHGGCGGISLARQPIATDPAVICDSMTATTYRLAPATIVGGVVRATASIPEGQVSWAVEVTLDPTASAELGRLTAQLAGTGKQLAIVVDGQVASAASVTSPITDGRLMITGSLTKASARRLAEALSR